MCRPLDAPSGRRFDPEQDRRYDLDFRVATCPAIVGENVTVRILDSRKAKIGLENLNHSDHVLEPFKRVVSGHIRQRMRLYDFLSNVQSVLCVDGTTVPHRVMITRS